MTQHITFKKLRIKNFLSIQGELVLDYDKYKGLVYVMGENFDVRNPEDSSGSGKSAIFLTALLYSIYGESEKNLKNNFYINRKAKKDCELDITFSIDNREYRIITSIKPASLTLLEDGIDITKSTMKETREYITNEVIRASFPVFRYAIAMSSSNESLFNMTNSQKREFIDSIFSYNTIGKIFKKVKTDISTVNKLQLQYQVSMAKSEKMLNELNVKSNGFLEAKQSKIDSAKTKLKELKTKYDSLLIESEELGELSSHEDIHSEKEIIYDKIRKLSTKKSEVLLKIQYLEKDIIASAKTLATYKNVYDAVSDCCKPKINSIVNVADANTVTEDNRKEIEKLKELSSKIDDKVDDIKNSELSAFNTKLRKYDEEVNRSRTIKNNLVSAKEVLKTDAQRIKDMLSETNPFVSMLEQYSADLIQDKQNWDIEESKIKYLKFLEFVFSPDGIKKWVTSKFINVLNQRIDTYLDIMGVVHRVLFAPDFDCRFIADKEECQFENFSNGEKTRLKVGLVFSLRDMLRIRGNLSSNILIVDEILDDGLNTVAVEAVMTILKKESLQSTVFVISHRVDISKADEQSTILKVKKENGRSIIE